VKRVAIGLTLLLSLAAVGAVPASARAPKKPGKVRVDRVSETAITLRWKDRSSNERAFKLRHRERGASRWIKERVARNRTKFRSRGLARGSAHEHQVRACGRGRCSRWSPVRLGATLLAGFDAPPPSLGSCEVLPPSRAPAGAPSEAGLAAWNQVVSSAPVHPRSSAIVDRIRADGSDDLHPDFGSNPEYGIPYVVVPGVQPDVPVRIGPDGFGGESDFGPAPIPPRAPVEGGSDNHALIVDRDECELYELYRAEYRGGPRNRWQADSTAFFDLGSASLRPDTFTSADAAGLPIFPGLVRFDEVASGSIDHAIRVTFAETRRAFLHPATHYASDSCDPVLPAMGMRLRLKGAYDVPALNGQARVIADALKRYGMIVADNGSNFFITGATDRRWDDDDLDRLKEIPGSAFEVVRSSASEITPC
jgi:hypothetical protein